MASIEELDAFFEYLQTNAAELLPDGLLDVNIKTLHALHLLSDDTPDTEPAPVAHLLQAIESGGKITLFNERFVLWIVPQQEAHPPTTVIYVAQRTEENGIKPELGFRTAGIHNRSKTILRLIDKFLTDIQETDSFLSKLEHMGAE